uniref:Uncharacterized protein n=1 Tax=Magallana gigas TaxID=29159 RepID=K1R6L1_MAGGI
MSNRRVSTAFETLQRRSSVQTPTLPRKFSLFNDNRSSQGEPRGRKLSFGEKQAKKRSSISKVREKDLEKVLSLAKIKNKCKFGEWLLDR